MRVIVRSPPAKRKHRSDPPIRARYPAPVFQVRWASPWKEFLGNLRAALDRRKPSLAYWRDIFPGLFARSWRPRHSLAASTLMHLAVLSLLWNLTPFLNLLRPSRPEQEESRNRLRLTWYRFADELPAVSPQPGSGAKRSEKGGRRRGPSRRGATAFHPQQVVISNPPRPDNDRQTIYQPETPHIRITGDVRLPNIVMWRELEKPLPPVDLVKREVARLTLPASLLHKNVELPQDIPNLERRISDLKLAANHLLHPNPRLPAPPATPGAGNTPANAELPPPPPPSAVTGGAAQANSQLRRLIAISRNPELPGGPIDVPAGNRAGSFSIAPEGKIPGTPHGTLAGLQGAGAVGPAAAGEDSGEGSGPAMGGGNGARDITQIRVPGLSVSGGGVSWRSGPVVSGPPPPAPAAAPRPAIPSPLRTPKPNEMAGLLARSTRPPLPAWSRGEPRADQGFLAGKKVYTLYINMPNLSSGAGSWILRFAELEDRQPAEEIELAAPVAVRKVDPGYVPDAIREKVEGLVVLHAIIRKDGRVERIEVLRSLDPRLDQRAVQALQRWEFQPATRNGAPVDLEAVVQIPFALPHSF